MKKEIVFATNNAHKLAEIRSIVGDSFHILSLADIGCHDDIPETSPTLEGNAVMKARWVKDRYGYDCFADDTGLEVDSLGGAPGVHSARYAPGEGHDSAANMALLLENLRGKVDRKARFRTVIALIQGTETHVFEGSVDGEIIDQPAGCGGFGYDPVFKPCGWDITFAEASPEDKNSISHRGRATRSLISFLLHKPT
ncbi:MAG: non-canonical purine NTP diphosphatase [Odoribacter sp.]|nr:non-canonical purine NTP diphosphatase [Odoribacter sp.]